MTYIPNDIGELENLKELTIHGNPLDKKVLEMLDLDSVLAYFRRQQIPPEYKRAMKALKKQMAGGNHEIELKNKKMKYFKKMLADARGSLYIFSTIVLWLLLIISIISNTISEAGFYVVFTEAIRG